MDRMDEDQDFVASARRLASELLPMLKGLAEAAYNPDWAERGTTKGVYAMLMSAALHQLATSDMAKEANRRPDVEAMFMGMKAYGMMWHCMIDVAGPELVAARESIH
jgi:hypothetical protein